MLSEDERKEEREPLNETGPNFIAQAVFGAETEDRERRGKNKSSFRIRHGLNKGTERSALSEQVTPKGRSFKHSSFISKIGSS